MLMITSWEPPPLSPPAPGPGELHLWWFGLDDADAVDEARLTPDERVRAERLRDQTSRRHFSAARNRLRQILGRYLSTPPESLVFRYGAQGKPALDPRHPALEFNLSHAAGAGMLVVANGAIGVDIEPLQPRKNSRAIARRVFDERIYARIANLPQPEFDVQFIHHWTHFEARSKCGGGGVFRPLAERMNALNFTPAPGWIGAVASRDPLPEATRWKTYHL